MGEVVAKERPDPMNFLVLIVEEKSKIVLRKLDKVSNQININLMRHVLSLNKSS